MNIFGLPFDHPGFPERITLILETWWTFAWAGAGHGLYSVAYSGCIQSKHSTMNGFVNNICPIIIFAAGSWKTFSSAMSRDYQLHYRSNPSQSLFLFLELLRMGGMIYTRSLLLKHASKFHVPLNYLSNNPSALAFILYRCLVFWGIWTIIPEMTIISSRGFTVPKFLARIVGVTIESYQQVQRSSGAARWIKQKGPEDNMKMLLRSLLNLPSEYKYSSIEHPRTIRLLQLQSGSNASCTLETISLDEAPPFWAVSYLWGSEEKPMWLNITDKSGNDAGYISITKNCSSAIQALTPITSEVRYLWVDAICINQADNLEKELQIPLMGDIYSRASLVAGHICTDNLYPLGLLIHKIVQALGNKKEFNMSYAAGYQIFNALGDLYQHPYFERAWIVQEMVLAKSLILVYGKDCIHFEHLMVIAGGQSKDLIKPGGSMLPADANAEQLVKMNLWNEFIMSIAKFRERGEVVDKLRFHVLSKERTSEQRLTIAQIVDENVPMGATNPRDQIYALLSLASDSSVPILQPNYSTSISNQHLFRDICWYYLEDGKHLNLFLSAGIAPRIPLGGNTMQTERTCDLPSWVYDFASGSSRNLRLGNWAVDMERNRSVRLNCRLSENRQVLKVQGVVIDSVSIVTPSTAGPKFPDGVSHPLKLWAGDEGSNLITTTIDSTRDIATKYTAEKYVDGSPRDEAYWRTMLMDRFLGCTPAPSDAQNILAMLYELAPKLSSITTSNLKPHSTLSRLGVEDGKKAIESIMNTVTRVWMPYSFVVTRGGYMGWAPHGVREGDLFVRFEGCVVPFVLRKMGEGEGEGDGNGCRLWGDGYLHGFLPGQKLGVEGMENRWFEIV